MSEEAFKARVVWLVLRGDLEKALEELSAHFGVEKPRVKVGLPKGHSRSLAVYDPKRKAIFFKNNDAMRNPFVVLHEFYHHLRMFAGKHRGTEKHADRFALSFITAYCEVLAGRGIVPRWCASIASRTD